MKKAGRQPLFKAPDSVAQNEDRIDRSERENRLGWKGKAIMAAAGAAALLQAWNGTDMFVGPKNRDALIAKDSHEYVELVDRCTIDTSVEAAIKAVAARHRCAVDGDEP